MYPINDASIGKKLEALPSPTLSPLFLTHGSNLEKDGFLLLLIKDGVTAVGLKIWTLVGEEQGKPSLGGCLYCDPNKLRVWLLEEHVHCGERRKGLSLLSSVSMRNCVPQFFCCCENT